ncbi:MAG: FtsX-like permease family protein [Bacteroidales bacterium]
MIKSIAWKNIWRNRNRSLVVITAVTLGIISGVLLVGIMKGWVEQRLRDAISNEVSHLQIHNSEFISNEEIDLTITGLAETESAIEALPEVSGWVKRSRVVAMANTPWATTGVIVYGIDPEREKSVTEIWKKIVPGAGEYPDISRPGEILISDKCAEILKLKHYIITEDVIDQLRGEKVPENILLRLPDLKETRFRSPKDFRDALKMRFTRRELDRYGNLITAAALDYRIRNRVLLTLSDDTGTPVQAAFRVCGIYKTTNTGFDQAALFVNARELAQLCGKDEIMTHEIAILLNDIKEAGNVKGKLEGISSGNSVRTWRELAPDAALMNDYMIMYYFMFIGIIMLALAFGIINTMLMAILERTRELGMLMAIGMNRKRIFSMIMLETIFLTLTGAVTGMIAGWAIVAVLGKTGIHFSGWGEGFEAMGFAARVYPVVTPDFFIFTTLMVVVTAFISSLWPARKALKLNPVEALRTE